MDSAVKPTSGQSMNPAQSGKKTKTNFLIPLVIVFLAIAAFLGVMYTGL